MSSMRALRSVSLLLFAGVVSFSSAQGDPQTVKRIIDCGKNYNNVMELLTHLCMDIGPRTTGTPECQIACEWTMHKFKQYGMQNVHLEKWGEFPVLFTRGGVMTAKMVAPFEKELIFSSNDWTPGTNGPRRGSVVAQPTNQAELDALGAKLKNAWVLMKDPVFMRGDRGVKLSEIDEQMNSMGIAGRVYVSRDDDLVWTHGDPNVAWNNLPKIPSIMITGREGRMIRLQMETGHPVELEINLGNRFINKPVPLYNVIAEIPGTEKPDEVVIVSGHLDSWNGPGSQGAQDNGTGSMVTLEAARLLIKANAQPKRTIRFILWTGEEQGLLGSRQYVKDHWLQRDKISAVFVDDGGTNYEGGYGVLASQKPMIEEAMKPMIAAFPEFPLRLDVVPALSGGGSDHDSFIRAGVPGLDTYESGKSDYRLVWHTQNDRLETVIPEYLIQSSTNAAVVAYNLACAKTLLPRK